MFINFSNHPSDKWSKQQLDAAHVYGDILDMPFPSVGADAPENELKTKAKETAELIEKHRPDCVLVQGEMTFTHALVNLLSEKNILTVAAVSERVSAERNSDSGTLKTSLFCFKRFRSYY